MSAQLKKGVLEMCVLSKIKVEDCYGYEIYQDINSKLDISESTIYPILRKLVKEGFFETYLKESNEGPPRKYFSITDLGLKKLEELEKNWVDFKGIIDNILGEEANND